MKRFVSILLVIFMLVMTVPAVADDGNAETDFFETEESEQEIVTEEQAEEQSAEEPAEEPAAEIPELTRAQWNDVLAAGMYDSGESLMLTGEWTLPEDKEIILHSGEWTLQSGASLIVEGVLRIDGGTLILEKGAKLINRQTICVSDAGVLRSEGKYEQTDDAKFVWNNASGASVVEGIDSKWLNPDTDAAEDDGANAEPEELQVAESVPTITTQPVSKTINLGESVTFSVVASNATAYQWYYMTVNGTKWNPVSADSSTTATLNLTPLAKHNGYRYRCKVSNSAGSVFSNEVMLTVKNVPKITTQPTSKTVTLGESVTFKVVASNAESYQWYYKTVNGTKWNPVSMTSGDTAAFSFTPQVKHNGYRYRCEVTNSEGSVISNEVTLTLIILPKITTQPKDQTVIAGETATFKVVASNATGYQWYYLPTGTSTWKASGSESGKTDTFTVTPQLKHSGYQYRCEVSSSDGSVMSDTVTLTVVVLPTITTQPKSHTAAAGEETTFSVVADNATVYKWYYKTVNGTKWNPVSAESSTTATLHLTPLAKHNGYQYRCEVSNEAGTVISNEVTLTVVVLPKITTQPKDQTVTEGSSVTFKVVANNATSYQWYYLPTGTSTWKASGADCGKTATFTVTPQVKHSGYKYRCVVSNDSGSVTSETATLTVNALLPEITKQPTNQTVMSGETATFMVVAKYATSYQWYYLPTGTTTWKASGAESGKTAIFTVTPQAKHSGYKYRCVITNASGSVTTDTVTLTVNVILPEITKQPSNQTTYSGQPATFSVTAKNATAYQWYYRSSASGTWTASGAESGKTANFTVTPQGKHNGYQYYCKVSNAEGSVSSDIVTLTVNVILPTITSQPSSITVDSGTTVTFKVVANNATNYQWYYRTSASGTWTASGSESGKTANFTVTPLAKHSGYQYYCKVSNAEGSVSSEIATLTVIPKTPVITVQPTNASVYSGTETTFSVVASNATSYQWYYRSSSSGTWTASGSASGKTANFTVTPKLKHSGYQYYCKVSNAEGSVSSDTVTLSVTPKPASVYDLSYWFSNSASSFGYSYTYRIPLDRYKRFFSSTLAKSYYDNAGYWGGNCFGMSSTSAMMWSENANLSPSWFGEECIDEIDPGTYSSKLKCNATYMIECAQVMQRAWSWYYKSISDVLAAARAGVQTGDFTVVAVWNSSGTSGHALLAYDVVTVSSTETRIYIYDCNYPYSTRYIKVMTNTSGTPTGWSYNGWANIGFVRYSTFRNVWVNGTGFSTSSTLWTDSSDYSILNSDGKVVGKMVNGEFYSMQEGVERVLLVDTNMEHPMIRMPSGEYTIVNDGSEPMKVDLVHNYRRAIVTLESGSVTLNVNDSDAVNQVSLNADARGSYSIQLISEKDRYQKVEYTGFCSGKGVLAGVKDGRLEIRTDENAELKVNDVQIPVVSEQEGNTDDPELELRAVEGGDRFMTAEIANLSGQEIRGEMMVASYDKDGKLIGISMQNAQLADEESTSGKYAVIPSAVSYRVFILDSASYQTTYRSNLVDR